MKRILYTALAVIGVIALVAGIYAFVSYGHTAVRPDENPPASQPYSVPHGTCTDVTHNGLPMRRCHVIIKGSEWDTGYIGRHTDPVKFLKQKVEFSVPR